MRAQTYSWHILVQNGVSYHPFIFISFYTVCSLFTWEDSALSLRAWCSNDARKKIIFVKFVGEIELAWNMRVYFWLPYYKNDIERDYSGAQP